MNSNSSHGAHSAEPTRSSRSRAPQSSGSGNAVKFVLLGLVLVLIVLVLVLLFVRGGRSSEITDAAASANLTSSVLAQDYSGKDIGKDITITAGTLAPPNVNPSDSILMDISWSGKKSPDYPIILTVSDPSFVNDNGLIVFHYENNQWVKVGTYTIADHSVTFLADSLSPFAFVPYEKYNTPTPEASATPAPTPTPTPTPTSSPSPSPSASPSPTAKSGGGGGGESPYVYDPAEQTVQPVEPDEPDEPTPTDPPVEPTEAPVPESGGDIEEADES